jgi:hypothetical protein
VFILGMAVTENNPYKRLLNYQWVFAVDLHSCAF